MNCNENIMQNSCNQWNSIDSNRPHLDDDDDDGFGGGFEMELANMDLDGGGEHMIGEGPENQQTCVKWVNYLFKKWWNVIAIDVRNKLPMYICVIV